MKKAFRFFVPVFAAVLGFGHLAVTTDAAAQPPRHAPAYGYDRHHDDRRGYGKHADKRRGYGKHSDKHRKYSRHGHDQRYWHRSQKRQHPAVYGYNRRPASTVIVIRTPGFSGFFDLTDRRHMHHALETARIGQPVIWNNPASGNRYTVVPTSTWQNADAAYCREYTTVGVIGGREQQLYGTACRQPDGSWASAQ